MITVRITLEMANMNVYYKNLVKRDGPRMGWQIKGLNISYIKFCIAKLQEVGVALCNNILVIIEVGVALCNSLQKHKTITCCGVGRSGSSRSKALPHRCRT